MPTQLIAAGTGASNSADVTVVAGTPVHFHLFVADGSPVKADVEIPIKRKNSQGTYSLCGLTLAGSHKDHGFGAGVVVTAPGVYRVERPSLASIGQSVGVDRD